LVNCDSPLELGKLLSVATDAWESVSVGGWSDPHTAIYAAMPVNSAI
jgi:hypothetical protein